MKKRIDDALKRKPQRKSMGQFVFEHLKHAIIKGELAPGRRLVEIHIAESMDISRTPVREAIHKLEREGLVEKLPRGGFAVAGLTREDIEETFGIRSVLESYAAGLAAAQHTDRDMKMLEKKNAEFLNALRRGELDALADINTAFHNQLYAMSYSPRLIRMISDLGDQIYRFRQIILRQESLAKTSHDDHGRMLKRIRARDVDGVERLVRRHILKGRDAVLTQLDNRGDEIPASTRKKNPRE